MLLCVVLTKLVFIRTEDFFNMFMPLHSLSHLNNDSGTELHKNTDLENIEIMALFLCKCWNNVYVHTLVTIYNASFFFFHI